MQALSASVSQVKPLRIFDGAVLFACAANPDTISNIRFFQNSFLVIKQFPSMRNRSVNSVLKRLLGGTPLERYSHLGAIKRAKSFRIVTSMRNKLVSVDRAALAKFEQQICRSIGCPVSRRGASIEFWIVVRDQGPGLFLLRLGRRGAAEKNLQKGQLRPEVGSLLCHLSEPTPHDRFLDPFCGYGTILHERMRIGPLSTITGIDLNSGKLAYAKKEAEKIKKGRTSLNLLVQMGDSRSLDQLPGAPISRIVTDPPWGYFDNSQGTIEGLYRDFLQRMKNHMGSGCILVLLLGRDGPMEQRVIPSMEWLTVEAEFKVLIAGKKATVLKVRCM